MNVSTMRRVDRWFGIPACFCLTRLRRLADSFFRRGGSESTAAQRIVFIKLAEQGATVLAYPALSRAVEMVGAENVYFVVFEENRFILDVMDIIPEENVIAIPTRTLAATTVGLATGLRKLRRIRADAAIDFEFFARASAILTYLSGAPMRVGLHRHNDPAPYRGDLMSHRIQYDPTLHTSQAFLSMVEALPGGTRPVPESVQTSSQQDDSCPQFTPAADELEKMTSKVAEEAGTSEFSPLVLLNANASDLLPLRRWPGDRYVELARRLLERFSTLRVAFCGSPAESLESTRLVGAVDSTRCFNLAGKTTLRELLTLYHVAHVLVTNDSGPSHFASMTPIEAITLFGPETPALFGARTPRSHILWKGLPCSPCVSAYNNRSSQCTDNRCMQEISVDEVFGAVSDALQARLSRGRQ